jgi:DNA-binding transcriptional LysR family regulator
MNWENLRIFDAAASMGSLSAGSQVVGMSQPQVSRRLRDLEEELGTRLFDRTPQGLRPTQSGSKLIPLVAEMRKAAETIARAKPDLAAKATRVVRISVDEIREHFLLSNLDFLRANLPEVELEIFSAHEHLDHESRMTDVQIRSCLPDNETLVAKRLGSTRYGFFASKDFLAAKASSLSGPALRRIPWIGISPDHLWYPAQKQVLDETFESPSILRFNTMTGVLRAAETGQGVALLPTFMARRSPLLEEISGLDSGLVTKEYLIVHRDLLREAAVRKVVDVLSELYLANRAELGDE